MNRLTHTQMSGFAINVAVFGEKHDIDVLTGGPYPFVSICTNGEERVVLEPTDGLRVFEYTLTPALLAAGVEVPENKVQVVTNFGGSYEYVQVIGMDGEEIFCHEVVKGMAS